MKLSEYNSSLGSIRVNERLTEEILEHLSLYEVEEGTLKKGFLLFTILGLLLLLAVVLLTGKNRALR